MNENSESENPFPYTLISSAQVVIPVSQKTLETLNVNDGDQAPDHVIMNAILLSVAEIATRDPEVNREFLTTLKKLN